MEGERNHNNSRKITVLGTGLVGRAIAADLARSGFTVSAVDLDKGVLAWLERMHDVRGWCADFTGEQLPELIAEADLVVGAAPGHLGYGLMRRVIMAGKPMVDISFCPEDFTELDPLARKMGVTVVPDMGVAPGMCNLLLGYHANRMEVDSYRCMVGGLPVERHWPLQYKSSWSPMDCMEEYVRPARIRIAGKDAERPAMSDLEEVDFPEVGTLEAWNSDGLRSLLSSFPEIPHMVEKTLRYPGTTEYLRVLRELGYFSFDQVEVSGNRIRPADLTAALLFPRMKLEKGEAEFTLMEVEIRGREEDRETTWKYHLYDTYDPVTDTSSMARTTGYACSGAARLILAGMLDEPGVVPPEKAGVTEENFRFILQHLSDRGVQYHPQRLVY